MEKSICTITVDMKSLDAIKRLVSTVAEICGDERTPGWIKERIKAFEMNSDGACVEKPAAGVIDCES